MTWTLNASGHSTSTTSTTNDEENERSLAAVLQKTIRSLPSDDIIGCTFTGKFVRGDLRTLDLT